MNVMQAIVLGVVEGVTEYLPVSSTGHLILTAAALGLGDGATTTAQLKEATDRFTIIIQGGAILAVAMLYWPRVRMMLRLDHEGRHLLTLLAAGFLPAAVTGLLAGKAIKTHLFGPLPVIAALMAGGVAMVLLAPWHRRRLRKARAAWPMTVSMLSASAHREIQPMAIAQAKAPATAMRHQPNSSRV